MTTAFFLRNMVSLQHFEDLLCFTKSFKTDQYDIQIFVFVM